MTYILVAWNDALDKDITDPSKFTVIKEGVTQPSLVGLVNYLEYFALRDTFDLPDGVDPLIAIKTNTITLIDTTVNVTNALGEQQPVRQYDKTYAVQLRPVADILSAVDEYEANANIQVFPYQKQLKYMLFYMMGLKRIQDGGTLTAYQQAFMDKVDAKGVKIWKNFIEAEAKKTAINNSGVYDISADWETADEE